jgi:hypothetical protein
MRARFIETKMAYLSNAACFDKHLDRHAGLLNCRSERSEGKFLMKGDDAPSITTAKDHMASFLPYRGKAKILENPDSVFAR